MTTPLELLAPAKNLACGMAAIDHGADAVYIGAQRFGARAAAGNSVTDIAELCRYAHRFRAKVYVTVNTIIYDDELADTRQLLQQLADAGADAVLAQDMALLSLMPTGRMALHASTQTDNRTADKVRWLGHQGFSRVVLARELSVSEIAAIHRQVPDVELEVFVHGALCVSYSGLCYASQHCFGRSANRGECAQFCRMKFNLTDADGREWQHQRYLLSLKDLCQIDALEELADAGARSFKIEGRLKDIDYVKNVTAAYRQQLDALIARHPDRYCRSSIGNSTFTFQPDLRKTFNRGYTHYFLHGRQPDIASFDTPKAMGEYVGYVKELRSGSFNVAGTVRFANGDGLCFINKEHQLEGFRVNRADGNCIYPLKMPASLRPGTRLYRNNDQEFERLLAKPTAIRKIPLTMQLEAFADDGFASGFGLKLITEAQSLWVRIHAEHQFARQSQRARIASELAKLGDTPFVCERVDIPDDFPYFIPASQLSQLRRFGIDALLSKIQEPACATEDEASAQPEQPADVPLPAYHQPYLYNIANQQAALFYQRQGVASAKAFELQPPQGEALIMQCRHCLRYALGHCVKHGGTQPPWREPLSLLLADGRRFRVAFDCQSCQMNIYA
mgnify:CR=1 FL=1